MANGVSKVQRLWMEGVDHARAGRWADAVAALQQLSREQPDHVGAWLKLSDVELKQGRYAAARAAALCAAARAARDPQAVLPAAKRLRYFEEHGALVQLLRDSVPRTHLSLDKALEAASLASSAGDHALAVQYLEGFGVSASRDPRWQYQWGTLMTFVGELDRAERAFETAIRQYPSLAQAHWMLAKMERASPTSHHVGRLKLELSKVPRGSEASVYLGLALHYELHVLERFDEAWSALEGTFSPGSWLPPYDPAEASARFSAIKERFPLAAEPARVPVEQELGFTPIFIVGMHRSGTSLLERVLAGSPEVADAGESYAFPAALRLEGDHDTREAVDAEIVGRSQGFDMTRLAARYGDLARWRCGGRKFLTEKLPHNFLNIGFIAEAIPSARIIHITRDPVDTCFSNLRTFFRRIGNYSYNQVHMAHFYGEHAALMRHWNASLGSRLCEINYADFVAHPEEVSRRVSEYCGLQFDQAMLDVRRSSGAVATASSAQVRAGFQSSRHGAWKPYEDRLGVLVKELQGTDLPGAAHG